MKIVLISVVLFIFGCSSTVNNARSTRLIKERTINGTTESVSSYVEFNGKWITIDDDYNSMNLKCSKKMPLGSSCTLQRCVDKNRKKKVEVTVCKSTILVKAQGKYNCSSDGAGLVNNGLIVGFGDQECTGSSEYSILYSTYTPKSKPKAK